MDIVSSVEDANRIWSGLSSSVKNQTMRRYKVFQIEPCGLIRIPSKILRMISSHLRRDPKGFHCFVLCCKHVKDSIGDYKDIVEPDFVVAHIERLLIRTKRLGMRLSVDYSRGYDTDRTVDVLVDSKRFKGVSCKIDLITGMIVDAFKYSPRGERLVDI